MPGRMAKQLPAPAQRFGTYRKYQPFRLQTAAQNRSEWIWVCGMPTAFSLT